MASRRLQRGIAFILAIGMFLQPTFSLAGVTGTTQQAPLEPVSVPFVFVQPGAIAAANEAAEEAASAAASTAVAQATASADESRAQSQAEYARVMQLLRSLEGQTAETTNVQVSADTEEQLADQVRDQIDANGAALVLFKTGTSTADAYAILDACGLVSVGSFSGSGLFMATPKDGVAMEAALLKLHGYDEVVAADSLTSHLNQEGSPANEPEPAEETAAGEPDATAPSADASACPDGIDPAGYVTDAATDLPLADADVTIVSELSGETIDLVTDETGYYSALVAAGAYLVSAVAEGYDSQTVRVEVVDVPVQVDFALTATAVASELADAVTSETAAPAAPAAEGSSDPVISGTGGTDDIYAEWDGTVLKVWVNALHTNPPTHTYTPPADGTEFHLQGLGGIDTITIVSIGAAVFPYAMFLEGGDGDDILDASGFYGDVTLDGGLGNDTLIGGHGSDRYVFDSPSAFGADTVTELAGGTNDRLDFSTYSGTVTPSVNGAGTLTLTGSRNGGTPETVTILQTSLLQMEGVVGMNTMLESAVRDAILSGFGQLVTWAEGLAGSGTLAQVLPLLGGANIPVTLKNALDLPGVLAKLLVNAQVALGAGAQTLSQLASALSATTSVDRFGSAVMATQIVDPSGLSGSLTFTLSATLHYALADETITKTLAITVALPLTMSQIADAINTQLADAWLSDEPAPLAENLDTTFYNDTMENRSSKWANAVQAAVTSDGRLVFDVLNTKIADRSRFLSGGHDTSADLTAFSVDPTNTNANTLMGFSTAKAASLTGVLELGEGRLGSLSLTVSAVPSFGFSGGKLVLGLALSLDASTNVQFMIDLGQYFNDHGVAFGADVELPLGVTLASEFDLTVAIDDSVTSGDFSATVSEFEVNGLISPATVNAVMNVGFLGATATGSINMAAGVWAPPADLATPQPLSAIAGLLEVKPTPSMSVSLTAHVGAGLSGPDDTPYNPVGATITLASANPFVPSTYAFDQWVVSTDFTNLFDFNRLTVSDIPAMLMRLANTIEGLANTTAFSQFKLPFLSSALDSLLDFIDAITDRLLLDDRDDSDPSNDIARLLKTDGSLNFTSAQSLADALHTVLGLSAGTIDATYDATAKELYYTIDLHAQLALLELPLDFSFSMAPLAGISSNTRVLLSAEAGINLQFGFDVSNWPNVPDDPSTTKVNEAVDEWLKHFFVRGVAGGHPDIYANLTLRPGWLLREVHIDATNANKLLVAPSSPIVVGSKIYLSANGDIPAGDPNFTTGTYTVNSVEPALVPFGGKDWRRVVLSGAAGGLGAFGNGILVKGVEATASFGFVSVTLKSPTGAEADGFTIGLGVSLLDPNNTDGKNRITLADIKAAIGTPSSVLSDVTWTGINPAEDRIRLEVTVSPSFPDFQLVPPGATISLAIAYSAGSGFSVVPDLSGLGATLPEFGDLSFANVLSALQALSGFLGQFEAFGFMSTDIPLIGKSVNDLLALGTKFAKALEAAQADPAGSLQLVEKMIADALGVAGNVIDFALVDGGSKILKMTIHIDKSVNLSANLGLPGISAGSLGMLSLTGSAGLALTASITGLLVIGIDLSTPTDVFLYSNTNLAATVSASGTNLKFSASLGPISLGVEGGSALISAGVTAGLDASGWADGKKLLSELGAIISAIDISVTGSASATLPVTFSGFSLGSFIIAMTDLTDPDTLSITLPDKLNDPEDFEALLASFSFFDSLKLIAGGVDSFLDMLQGLVSGDLAKIKLPILGDQLANAAQFIEKFRRDFVQPLTDAIEAIQNAAVDFADPERNQLSIQIYKLLGPPGLDVLRDSNGDDAITIADVVLGTNYDPEDMPSFSEMYMQWVVDIGDTYEVGSGIGFDLAIPGLGLSTTGAIKLVLNWSLKLGFGLSGDKGFYLVDIPDRPELAVDARIALDAVSITGKLAFLQLTAADADVAGDSGKSAFGVQLAVDVTGTTSTLAGAPDIDVFAIGDFGSLSVAVTVAAIARAELALTLGISGTSAGFPSIKAGFLLNFGFGNLAPFDPDHPDFDQMLADSTRVSIGGIDWATALTAVGFINIRLDLGSFIAKMIGPTLNEINKAIAPMQEIVDVMVAPIPVISDLMGQPISLKTLAEIFGEVDLGWIDSVDEIIDFIAMVTALGSTPGELYIPFGDFWVYGGEGSNTTPIWEFGANKDSITAPDDPWGGQSFASKIGTIMDGNAATKTAMTDLANAADDDDYGFSFPLFDDPKQIFQLLMGKDVGLIEYRMKPFYFEFEYSQFFPIIGPLGVSITGSVGIKIQIGFGYGTRGIREFVESDFKNVAALLDGFYLTDTVGGEDVPEIKVWGGISAAAQLSLLMVEAGVAGGIYITVNFNLNDPNNDGQVYFSEMAANFFAEAKFGSQDVVMAALSIFDVYGDLSVRLWAFLKVNLFIFKIDWEMDIVPMTPIVEFSVDFFRGPQLATESLGYDGLTDLGGDLILNMGPSAALRSRGDLNGDADEVWTVTDEGTPGWVLVSSSSHPGGSQKYYVTGKIIAKGGGGNDTIDCSGVTQAIPCILDGGPGNDILKAPSGGGQAIIIGGPGDDTIVGGAGPDQIWGGAGGDTIDGGAGNNIIFGDEGMLTDHGSNKYTLDVLVGNADGNDTITGGDDSDAIFGAGGKDTIDGGDGADVIFGDTGSITFTFGSITIERVSNTEVAKRGDADTIDAGDGDDFVWAGVGNDTIEGGDGRDYLFGESGFDTIHGGGGNDDIFGDGWVLKGIDPLHLYFPASGGDSDTLFGDADDDYIWGGGGEDKIEGGGGNDYLYGGAGADVLWGDGQSHADTDGMDHLYGQLDNDQLFGGDEADTLDGGEGDDILFGAFGPNSYIDGLTNGSKRESEILPNPDDATKPSRDNDTLFWYAGSDLLDGQGGSDEYRLDFRGGEAVARVYVLDSGATEDGVDLMIVYGSPYDDIFLLRAVADVDMAAFVAMLNPDDRAERADYDNIERLVVNGQVGNDKFFMDDAHAEVTLNGGAGQDVFQIGQLFRSERAWDHVSDDVDGHAPVTPDYLGPLILDPFPRVGTVKYLTATDPYRYVGGDQFTTELTTRGFLSNGCSVSPVTANGGPGNDFFTVYHNMQVANLNGEAGDDVFLIKAFALAGSQEPKRGRTDVSGGDGTDLVQYVVNAPVNIDGGDGFDRVIIVGTEFGDDLVITKFGVYGAGLNVNYVNIESLEVDGAEGDDRFYVQSTSEKFVTRISGGLGNDTFYMSGDVPPVISNDLLGHSGIITHSIEVGDGLYTEDLKVEGISANVADNEEPAIRITLTNGSTEVLEGSVGADAYTIVLTREPTHDVLVRAMAPTRSPTDEEMGAYSFRVFSTEAGSMTEYDGSAVTLLFTPANWDEPQWVFVAADWSGPEADPQSVNYDDLAYEGTRYGFINHTVEQEYGSYRGALLSQIVDDEIVDYRSTTGYRTETTVTVSHDVDIEGNPIPYPFVEHELIGATLEMVGGPGIGQRLLIRDNTADQLILFGEFRSGNMPAFDGSSTYLIRRYHYLALPSVLVKVYDNDSAGVGATQMDPVVAFPDGVTAVIENGQTDRIAVSITREPTVPVQIALTNKNGEVTLSSTLLTFNPGPGWNLAQFVTITAVNDSEREGRHYGLIELTIVAGDPDADVPDHTDKFELTQTPEVPDLVFNADVVQRPDAFVGLSHNPKDGVVSSVTTVEDGETRVLVVDVDYYVEGNLIVFTDDRGIAREVTGLVTVVYTYVVPGYLRPPETPLFIDPVLAEIGDDDVPNVIIRELGGTTDVIESADHQDDGMPWMDWYTVVLAKQPTADVTIAITPQPTKTTRGRIRWDLPQVQVSSSEPTAQLVTRVVTNIRDDDFNVTVVLLTFTPDNWDVPQIVEVRARDNDGMADEADTATQGVIDGADTQVFASKYHTVADIQGPVFVEGAGGSGSLVSPVGQMLPGETNIKEPAANVVAYSVGEELTTITVNLDQAMLLGGFEPDDDVSKLLNCTVEITSGSAIDQFRLITAVEVSGDNVVLTLNLPYNLAEGDAITAATMYTITHESLTFFVDESKMIDLMIVWDEESVADSYGALTNLSTLDFPNNATVAEFVTKLDARRLTGLQMGGDLYVGGYLQPGGITYGGLEVVEINLGSGDNTFDITNTHYRPDFQTWTMVNTGSGDDNVSIDIARVRHVEDVAESVGDPLSLTPVVRLAGTDFAVDELVGFVVEIKRGDQVIALREVIANTADTITLSGPWDLDKDKQPVTALPGDECTIRMEDGPLAVNGQTGDDVINGTPSSIPLVLFGSEGDDQLWGGSADDIIFGDLGRVDYYDENGKLVTRLGVDRAEMVGVIRWAANVVTAPADPLTWTATLTLEDMFDMMPFWDDWYIDDILRGVEFQTVNGPGFGQFTYVLSYTHNTLLVRGNFDPIPYDPDIEDSTWRIPILPENQTDGVVRAPTLVMSRNRDIGGQDVIMGGQGDDLILGGADRDFIFGDGGGSVPGDGADTIFGDNGKVEFDLSGGSYDDDPNTMDRAYTLDPEYGDLDAILGDGNDDVIFGGTAGDWILGSGGNDIVLGDFGEVRFGTVYVTMLGTTTRRTEYPLWLTVTDDELGGVDLIWGGAGEDVVVGSAFGDLLDGGPDDDLIFGDCVTLDRQTTYSDFTNPRYRTAAGAMYDEDGNVVVGVAALNVPALTGTPVWGNWDITLLHHDADHDAAPTSVCGDDYIAGGANDDTIFGQLGNDTIQGDGSITSAVSDGVFAGAGRNGTGGLDVVASFEDTTDGDDYIEGNGGNDVIFGNLGQDDIVGGSSSLFSLTAVSMRPDGEDLLFGGAGTDIERNTYGDGLHARDADMIVGDNANVYRIVSAGAGGITTYRTFNYDTYAGTLRLIPRAAELLDYTPGGPSYIPASAANDIGGPDEIHGESGDDAIYGMRDDDVLFGESGDDDIIGGWGNDWISGGTDADGVLGDDGRIYTSRNSATYGEPLYGIAALLSRDPDAKYSNGNVLDEFIYTPGQIQTATINKSGELKKTVNLEPFNLDPAGATGEIQDPLDDPTDADDIIYGGLGGDFLHGGAGDDAISGAEALPVFYAAPENPGDVLGYSMYKAGEFADYDEYDPWSKVAGFLLNFDQTEGPSLPGGTVSKGVTYPAVNTDGDDVIFGDLGNDWLVGGTGKDTIYGGYGDDLLDADDDKDTAGGTNSTYDTHPSYEDRAYGGAGRDVLIGNTGGDRLIDWVGEFNSYIVPFAPFGIATISRTLQPQLPEFLYALSLSGGVDPTRAADTGNAVARNGEPDGELGLVLQKDADWQDQTGAPADPQAGNIPGGSRDVLRSASFNTGTAEGFAPDSGTWTVKSGRLEVAPSKLGGDAASVFYVDAYLPHYYEVTCVINAAKPLAGYKANAYLIFDYRSPTDFKFGGINISTDQLELGYRDASGWHVVAKKPAQLKPDTDYRVMLSVNGTYVMVVVNNVQAFAYTFAPHVDADGYVSMLNEGMVGLGAFNAKARIDNVAVQVLPPVIAYSNSVDFETDPSALMAAPVAGAWTLVKGKAKVTPAAGETAIALTRVSVDSAYNVRLESTLTVAGTAGFVFDYYDADDYKFVWLDAATGAVVLGHVRHGSFVVDATAPLGITGGSTHKLALWLQGNVATVLVDGKQVIIRTYNALVTDGATGLVARGAAASFDSLALTSSDPAVVIAPASEYWSHQLIK